MIINELTNWYLSKGIEIWGEILISLAIIAITIISRRALTYIIIKVFSKKHSKKENIKGNAFYMPIKSFFLVLGIYIAIGYLKMPESFMQIVDKTFRIITILLLAKGFSNILEPGSSIYDKLKENEKISQNENILKFISKGVKIAIYTIAVFLIVTELGFNLSGIVTGLGLGSVVLALAVQDIATSLLAGAVILMDKPFSIGDYIKVKEYEGTVEEIKFRNTKLRLVNGSSVTIPNEVLTSESVTNWNELKERRIDINLNVMHNTEPTRLKEFLNQVKEILKQNSEIKEETINVHFKEITNNSIGINIYCNTTVTELSKYLDLKEEVNFLIMEILKNNQISLAYQTQNIYVKN